MEAVNVQLVHGTWGWGLEYLERQQGYDCIVDPECTGEFMFEYVQQEIRHISQTRLAGNMG